MSSKDFAARPKNYRPLIHRAVRSAAQFRSVIAELLEPRLLMSVVQFDEWTRTAGPGDSITVATGDTLSIYGTNLSDDGESKACLIKKRKGKIGVFHSQSYKLAA